LFQNSLVLTNDNDDKYELFDKEKNNSSAFLSLRFADPISKCKIYD